MNPRKILPAVASVLALAAISAHALQVYSFSNLGGTSIQFNGSAYSFQFNGDSSGHQWSITGESGGSGALNLVGWFAGGPFVYNAITGTSIQSTTVNPAPPAILTIDDGTGTYATANVAWIDLTSIGGVEAFNANLQVNLSNLHYSGLNSDLLSFFSAPAGQLNLSCQFDPAMGLTQLSSGTSTYCATSFNGTLTPVPEPSSVWLLLSGFILLPAFAFFKRKSQSPSQ